MTGNGWHHDQRRAMIQTECNGWSAYAANIFNASRQSSGSRAVDDHATDTMTGTAHMLSDCVPSMTTATPSVGMYNGECFMFYVSHTGVRALRVLSSYR